MNIALVEDDPAICEVVTFALELAGYSVLSWPDGSSFLRWITEHRKEAMVSLDVLITDWSLPGGCGGDLIDGLHQADNGADLPIIIITGTSAEQRHCIRTRYPCVPILRKPFHIQDLLTHIHQVADVETLLM